MACDTLTVDAPFGVTNMHIEHVTTAEIASQDVPVRLCDDLTLMLATFHAAALFTVLDALRRSLVEIENCDAGLVSCRVSCDNSDVEHSVEPFGVKTL
jgi:hypothetical protein